MEKVKIKVHNPSNEDLIDYRQINVIQEDLPDGVSLKEMTDESREKMFALLKKKGFRFGFDLWKDKTGKYWAVDGHGRLNVLKHYNITDMKGRYLFPFREIFAESLEEAAHLLLDVSSSFNRITQKGLVAFMDFYRIETDYTNVVSLEALDLWSKSNKKKKGGDAPVIKPEVVFSEHIGEQNNFIVLTFDNEVDWLSAQTHFNLPTVSSMRSNGKPWSRGIGRVVKGGEYLNQITKS